MRCRSTLNRDQGAALRAAQRAGPERGPRAPQGRSQPHGRGSPEPGRADRGRVRNPLARSTRRADPLPERRPPLTRRRDTYASGGRGAAPKPRHAGQAPPRTHTRGIQTPQAPQCRSSSRALHIAGLGGGPAGTSLRARADPPTRARSCPTRRPRNHPAGGPEAAKNVSLAITADGQPSDVLRHGVRGFVPST
jgi:hypothetical protein